MAVEKRKISVNAIVEDLRGGLRGSDLMEKYSLSHKQLKKVLERLVDRGFITRMQMFEANPLSDSAVMQAFPGWEEVVSRQQKPTSLEPQGRIGEYDRVECSQVVDPEEPTLRNMFEKLLNGAQSGRAKRPQIEPES